MDVFVPSLQSTPYDVSAPAWVSTRTFLESFSRERALAGFSSEETATFIFSLKRPIFDALRDIAAGDSDKLFEDVWAATELLDKLGLHTVRAFQKTREEIIGRQLQEVLDLSTPIMKVRRGSAGALELELTGSGPGGPARGPPQWVVAVTAASDFRPTRPVRNRTRRRTRDLALHTAFERYAAEAISVVKDQIDNYQ